MVITESWVMPSSAPADERRRDEHAVAGHEDVLAGALAPRSPAGSA